MSNKTNLLTVGDLKKALSKIPDGIPIRSQSSHDSWEGCDGGFIYIPDEKLYFLGIDDFCTY